MPRPRSQLLRHVAGATVSISTPFSDLPVPENQAELTADVIDRWVGPLYGVNFSPQNFLEHYPAVRESVSVDLVEMLLGDFNWRTRIVGAGIAAIEEFRELEDSIGNLLLQSEVCFAGNGYCIALASFSSPRSGDILSTYLDFYLRRLDLDFDQAYAMCALEYVDEELGTSHARAFAGLWNDFVAAQPHQDLGQKREGFRVRMDTVLTLRAGHAA